MHVVQPLSGLPLLFGEENKNLCILVVFLQFTHFRKKTNAKNVFNGLKFDTLILCAVPTSPENKAQNGNDKNGQQVINHIEWQNLLRIRFSIVFKNVFSLLSLLLPSVLSICKPFMTQPFRKKKSLHMITNKMQFHPDMRLEKTAATSSK